MLQYLSGQLGISQLVGESNCEATLTRLNTSQADDTARHTTPPHHTTTFFFFFFFLGIDPVTAHKQVGSHMGNTGRYSAHGDIMLIGHIVLYTKYCIHEAQCTYGKVHKGNAHQLCSSRSYYIKT